MSARRFSLRDITRDIAPFIREVVKTIILYLEKQVKQHADIKAVNKYYILL